MFHHPRIAELLFNQPLMIAPDKGEVIVEVFRKYSEVNAPGTPVATTMEDVVPREDLLGVSAERTQGGYLRTMDGIAIIPVVGSLVHRGGLMDAMSGMTSYVRLANTLQASLADSRVKAVVLEVDSPGGSSAGIFELAAMISKASEQKPVYSVANEQAFSGGYLLLAAASKAYMTEPGMVGSVGVVMYHVDQSKALEKRGVVVTPIYAGDRKIDFSTHAPLSESAMAWAQDSVNRTYDRFTGAVAQYRAISVDLIKETQAGLLHSDQATSLKFVDGVATLREVLALAKDRTKLQFAYDFNNGVSAAALNAHNLKEQQMETKDMTAAPTGAAQQTVTAEQLATATEQGRQLGLAEGAKIERVRIAEILGAEEAKGRMTLAMHLATKTEMAPADVKAVLKASAVEPQAAVTANEFAKAMGGVTNPKVGLAGPDQDQSGEQRTVVSIDAGSVFEKRRLAAEQRSK